MGAFVFGCRISRVLSSDDLFTRTVLFVKSRSSSVSAKISPARNPVNQATENSVLNGSRASAMMS